MENSWKIKVYAILKKMKKFVAFQVFFSMKQLTCAVYENVGNKLSVFNLPVPDFKIFGLQLFDSTGCQSYRK